MEERTIEISVDEYRKLIELKGRVNAALISIEANEYTPYNVLRGILSGKSVESSEDEAYDE